eukprot:3015930-Amphidinium_carterae.1
MGPPSARGQSQRTQRTGPVRQIVNTCAAKNHISEPSEPKLVNRTISVPCVCLTCLCSRSTFKAMRPMSLVGAHEHELFDKPLQKTKIVES